MIVCDGGVLNGSHCCWLDGVECEHVVITGGMARCSIWDQIPSEFYLTTRAGRYMEERWPGYTCKDWPQNIPSEMASGIGLCCWQGD